MNRHIFYLKRSYRQMTANPASLVIIIFSFTVCAFSLFVLINQLLYSTTFLLRRNESRKNYTIVSNIADNTALVRELLYSDTLPEISDIIGLTAYPSGGSRQNISALLCGADDRLDRIPDIFSGRTFTSYELESGASVIIWCNNEIYINSGLRERKELGDSVTIGNGVYTVIGISESNIYLPFNTAFSNDDFEIRLSGIRFSKIPTNDEINNLESLAIAHDCTAISRYESELKSFLGNGFVCLIIIIGIILCVICIVSSLFDYMVKSMLYEYSTYKLLGITNGGLFELLYLPLVIITADSLIAGYILFCLSDPLQKLLNMYGRIDTATAIAVTAIMLAIMLFVTVPKYRRLFSADVIGGIEL